MNIDVQVQGWWTLANEKNFKFAYAVKSLANCHQNLKLTDHYDASHRPR